MSLEIKVPPVGESITEVVLSQWVKKDGDFVEMDEIIAELESDKATFELTAEKAGILKTVASEGDTLPIGAVVCTIEEGEGKAESSKSESPKAEAPVADKVSAPVAEKSGESYASGTPSPSAAKILAEKGVDAGAVKGTGVDGRITKEDAMNAVPSMGTPTGGNRGTERTKLSMLRRKVAERLVAAKNETAMLTTFNEVDMTRINQIRDTYKKTFEEKNGIGLGFMSFFTKACTLSLQKYPSINAYIDDENIVYHDFCDISIAVSTPKGLVVPVIRNAESMSFAEIEKDIKRLALLGRDGNLSMQDMEGGTFTITNGGVFGSLMSTPIINQPQSAILGMHKIQDRPMAINGKVEIRPMMYLALSYDHRIVDGKESVGFLVSVKDYLENPEKMLVGVDPVKALLEL